MKLENRHIINLISCQYCLDEVENNLIVYSVYVFRNALFSYRVLCVELHNNNLLYSIMCFPFYNSKNVFNLPDLEKHI